MTIIFVFRDGDHPELRRHMHERPRYRSIVILVALFVTLIPTTIGALAFGHRYCGYGSSGSLQRSRHVGARGRGSGRRRLHCCSIRPVPSRSATAKPSAVQDSLRSVDRAGTRRCCAIGLACLTKRLRDAPIVVLAKGDNMVFAAAILCRACRLTFIPFTCANPNERRRWCGRRPGFARVRSISMFELSSTVRVGRQASLGGAAW